MTKEIKPIFPEEVFAKYLAKFDVKDPKTMDKAQIEEVFVITSNDFFQDNLPLSDYSAIANRLFGLITQFDQKKLSDVGSTILSAGELTFYEMTKSEVDKNWALRNIKEFLEKRTQ